VALETEDGEPLPADVASSGLSLKITPPGEQHIHQQCTSERPDDVNSYASGWDSSQFRRHLTSLAWQHVAGAAGAALLALPPQDSEGGPGAGDGMFVFPLGELTEAGTYAAVAEYTEERAAVLPGMTNVCESDWWPGRVPIPK
jgi:hypothetical protein